MMTRKEWFFWGLACCIKLSLALLIHPRLRSGPFAVSGGDTFSYLDPVENLFRHGTYAQDLTRLATYAGRMPGYGVVYGAARLLFSPGAAADAVVALQLLLSLGALYGLGRLAQAATGRPAAFGWAVLLFAANTFTSVFDIRLLTESFAISALILGVYWFQLALRHASGRWWLLGAGCLLAWAVFLRPFLAPVLGLLAGWYLIRPFLVAGGRPPASLRPYLLRGSLLLLPFLVADGTWMARNWRWYHRLVPLQSDTWAGYKTAPALRELTGFMGTLGEEAAWWIPSNDIAWFYKPATDPAPNFQNEPGKMAPPAYTYDSLLLVRHHLAVVQDSTRPLPSRQAAEARAVRSVVAYQEAFWRLRPARAFLLAPAKLAYRLVLAHPGDYLFTRPFAQLPPLQKGLKIAVHLWYWLLVGLGGLGILLVGWRLRFATLIVKAVPIYLIVMLCVVMRLADARYFALAYPFVIISAVNLLLILRETVQRIRQSNRTLAVGK